MLTLQDLKWIVKKVKIHKKVPTAWYLLERGEHSGLILGILTGLFFLIELLVLFAGRMDGFIGVIVLAWLVSPYGLPQEAFRLTERRADFNQMLKSI